MIEIPKTVDTGGSSTAKNLVAGQEKAEDSTAGITRWATETQDPDSDVSENWVRLEG